MKQAQNRNVVRLLLTFTIAGYCSGAVNLLGLELPNVDLIEDKRGVGMPFTHETPSALFGCNDDLVTEAHPCHHKNLKLTATHAGREQTQVPIYGILTQPYESDELDTPDEYGQYAYVETPLNGTYIKMSHVKYLEQGGARIVPVSYKLDANQLNSLLSQLNGVYIPGDSADVLTNERYLSSIKSILLWAQSHNTDSHFPLIAVGYGYLGLMMQGIKSEYTIQAVPAERYFSNEQINLRLAPELTYTFDGYNLTQLEDLLNQVTFLHELIYSIPLDRFLGESLLSSVFVPIATIHEEKKDQEGEFVAMVEGAHFPFFGSALSLDKIQFNEESGLGVDQSKAAVKLAQRIANLFVDEARLSSNKFTQARDEYKAVIQNYDAKVVEGGAEMYLF
ncbi:hypothetical protein FGO68_gene9085 [Halteria grandinella]|uniref:Folate gamma-glutamyl hydrolase n=1 Tax=Halteria grandinella TaxID=5974 RepID=A0A8J8T7H6_HALGN|nr:hypothetical protein FGO68_gene9085 [Halteria grandinella]